MSLEEKREGEGGRRREEEEEEEEEEQQQLKERGQGEQDSLTPKKIIESQVSYLQSPRLVENEGGNEI